MVEMDDPDLKPILEQLTKLQKTVDKIGEETSWTAGFLTTVLWIVVIAAGGLIVGYVRYHLL